MNDVFRDPITHTDKKTTKSSSQLNWLRAAVLGANDGIVSISALLVGVAGASNSTHFILTAGVAGTVAGALSMAVGEYVSVSSQRDAEKVMKYHPDELVNPWHAGIASAISFVGGAVIPMLAASLASPSLRIPIIFAAVIVALSVTGTLSAHVGGASKIRAAFRVVVGGILAMAITFMIGKIFGVSGI